MSTLLFQLSHDSSRPRIMFVLQSQMNSHARKLADESSFQIDTFLITDLLVNITKHQLLPKHEILSAEEQQSLLKKLDVQPGQMPRMLETDHIVKYYGLEMYKFEAIHGAQAPELFSTAPSLTIPKAITNAGLQASEIGDIPDAEIKPPENVLFVCKLNPVTEMSPLSLFRFVHIYL